MGFMRAAGKPVLGYSNVVADLATRARAFRARGVASDDCDRPDVEIEDFGLADNLMMAVGVAVSGSAVQLHSADPSALMTDLTAFERCLAEARRLFGIA
jgi:nucleoside 2-deoxyribosyltransferase